MSITGISYASGPFSLRKELLTTEAQQSGYFSKFTCYTPDDIPNYFKEQHKEIWSIRGGYWCWKPFIILRELRKIPDDHYLIYVDAGCSFISTEAARKRFAEYIDMLKNDPIGLLGFKIGDCYADQNYTNEATREYFSKRFGRTIDYSGGHVVGGIVLLKKTRHTLSLFEELITILSEDDKLYTDIYTKPHEQHRHDQSVYSLLIKYRGYTNLILADETFWKPFDCAESLKVPIWATRKHNIQIRQ